MRMLVTGGAGFIGSNFIRHLLGLGRGYEVVNFDKLTYAGNLANLHSVAADPAYSFVRGDICDATAVKQAMDGCDAVVHFAAESHVDRSIYDPSAAIETNVTGTYILLKVALEAKVRRFVHVSTDEVYGDLEPGAAATEEFSLLPNSPYSASKAGSDCLVRSYVRTFGLSAMITRASNNYGPYQFPEKFIPLMICNALDSKPLPVYGDGKQERDWLHVEDHCRALVAVLERGRVGEVYNVAGGNVYRNLDIVRRLLRAVDRPESLIKFVTDRPGHDRRYALDAGKISAELGWRPQVTFDEGLEDTVRWYRANPDWVDSVRAGDYVNYYNTYYVNRQESLRAVMSAGHS